MSDNTQRVICVVGIGRSGTSLVAGILNLQGVYLGKDLLKANTLSNPKGHWEHRKFVEINDRILNHLGGRWDNPPISVVNWENRFLNIEFEVKEIIQKEFSTSPLWGFKDPRTSLTLPFWQRIIPHMEYIVCMRNVEDVAASLTQTVYNLPIPKSRKLWERYNASIQKYTEGKRKMTVEYNDLVDYPEEQVLRIAQFLGVPVKQEAIHFVDPSLRRNCIKRTREGYYVS